MKKGLGLRRPYEEEYVWVLDKPKDDAVSTVKLKV